MIRQLVPQTDQRRPTNDPYLIRIWLIHEVSRVEHTAIAVEQHLHRNNICSRFFQSFVLDFDPTFWGRNDRAVLSSRTYSGTVYLIATFNSPDSAWNWASVLAKIPTGIYDLLTNNCRNYVVNCAVLLASYYRVPVTWKNIRAGLEAATQKNMEKALMASAIALILPPVGFAGLAVAPLVRAAQLDRYWTARYNLANSHPDIVWGEE
jgi:hypothetical protein